MKRALAWWTAVLVVAVACNGDDYLTGLSSGEIALSAADAGRPFSITLTGAAEVPGPGDPDGTGLASLTLNPGRNSVCWEVTWSDIEEPTAAHIHRGDVTVAGPVVVPLDPIAEGCADGVDRALILEIIRDPADFYVNVHNATFPAGAIRGQLTK